MKTSSQPKKIHSNPSLSRLRIAAASTLVLAAAALAATSMKPPKLPWAAPTVTVGNVPLVAAVDQDTDTIYVTNTGDNTVSVIDGGKCNEGNHSRCSPIATLTVGPNPFWVIFDQTTGTLYVGITGGNPNTIAVVNAKTCNAKNTSGCGQTPAMVTLAPGVSAFGVIALDPATHSLYVGDANDGPVMIIDTTACNAMNSTGCSQTPVSATANGDGIAIDYSNHSVYVTNSSAQTVSVFNGATCNATTQSNCTEFSVAPLPAGFSTFGSAVDQPTHTLYVPLLAFADILGYTAVIDASACNGTVQSGCGQTPHLVQVGSMAVQAIIDPTTKTVYVLSENSSTVSVINVATCNGTNQSGCPQRAPAIAAGVNPGGGIDIDLKTHTLYEPSQDTNAVWVLDASKCNAMHTSGCTQFVPTTTVGAEPVGVAANPDTRTLYVANGQDNTVSVIDTTTCNEDHLAGCNQTWPTINVASPNNFGINRVTNTIYVSNIGGTLSVINGATCNGKTISGCMQTPPTTAVGGGPTWIAVDETTNTVYVVNQSDNTVSVINGAHCKGTDTTKCNQVWPTVTVGAVPLSLAFNPENLTIYVANLGDRTVSVINTLHCNGTDPSGCGQTPATIPVGRQPNSVGIVTATNTVFVGNRNDLTVSVIDGSTCNGTNTSGCGQVPPTVLVGAFPSTAGNGNNVLGRSITVDSTRHTIYIPNKADSDMATLDTNACRAGHANDCHVQIIHERMGGNPFVATIDQSSGTVYVSDLFDGTVSLFPTRSPCDENQVDAEGCD